MSEKLADKAVKALPAPKSGNRITYDSEVKGFGIRVTAAGGRSFVLNYRRKSDGLERRYTIGSVPDWSVAVAREEAKRLKRDIDGGADPVGEDRANREAPTVTNLCDRFEAQHLPKKRPSTRLDYSAAIRLYIKPELGKRKVVSIEFTDVDALHRTITKKAPYRANRVVSILSKMFSLAVQWKLRPDNPCKGIERNDEAGRQRYLTSAELPRLTKALTEHPDRQAANIFRLLLLTGARRGEVLAARWADVDLESGVWTKPGASTKRRTEHRVPLSAPARQLITKLEQTESEYLFPGRSEGHRVEVKGNWAAICKAAKITGLRIHDLRHSYASSSRRALAWACTRLARCLATHSRRQPQNTRT